MTFAYGNPVPTPDAPTDVFPNNVVEVLVTQLQAAFPAIETILRRPLRTSDPTMSLGAFPVDWLPTTLEIGNSGPSLSRYNFAVQTLTKEGNEEEGRRNSGFLAKSVRQMLYSNSALRVQLAQLSEATVTQIERVQRWGITRQQFASNNLQTQMIHFSSTQIWVETEIV